ncbi:MULTISPECIES: DUF6230 family protein [Kitasatospora]|uniref:Putative cholesterol esterase n=1 Tax=Kitasatospora setae (strain ATCC 33774 / DSM 43861 / JCM 3304 / KCC A-0304 / NBRC 14216 / KM-6054) TaxID=452652 RepID=E4NH57_KITSK|nr:MULTISPECIES: DUF6230 family protein [Kitasatospora]BAJ30837.1 putative cholesterol esterase [Kitasatospora setae KM-6054]
MSQSYGKTRWKRFALVMVPSVAATAAIGVSLANSALAASFAVSGQQFKVTVEDLHGDRFSQFGGVDVEANGTRHPVAVSAFDSARLQNLCQSVVTDLSGFGLGKWTLVLKAGDSSDEAKQVHAENLLIDLNQLEADATFTNINIGQDASTLQGSAADKVRKIPAPGGLPTGPMGFSQTADTAHLTGVKQTAWATSAGTFTLNGLHLNLNKQEDGKTYECY